MVNIFYSCSSEVSADPQSVTQRSVRDFTVKQMPLTLTIDNYGMFSFFMHVFFKKSNQLALNVLITFWEAWSGEQIIFNGVSLFLFFNTYTGESCNIASLGHNPGP